MIGASETAEEAARSEGACSVYVYGVTQNAPAGAGGVGKGVGSEPAPVRVVESAGLAAVVSDVPASWRAAGRSDVEAHDRVLAQLIDARTVVPMRFGTVLDSDQHVRERLLDRYAGELASLLQFLDGRVQMTVKAYYVDDALLREVLRRRPELKRRADELEHRPVETTQRERIALGREVSDAVEVQRSLDEQLLVAPLAEVADDVRVQPAAGDRQAVTVQLLIAQPERERLDGVVRALVEQHRGRFAFKYVGPIPPYSFCDLSLDEEP
jgi:hypothetical protein